MSSIDYAYARELLLKINGLRVNQCSLTEIFTFENTGISLWSFQQAALMDDVRVFSKSKRFHAFALLRGLDAKHGFTIKEGLALVVSFGMSVLLWFRLRLRRAPVLTFGSDLLSSAHTLNPRLAAISALLKQDGISSGEILHTLFNRDFWKNILRRRRLVGYLEATRLLYFWVANQSPEYKYRHILSSINLDSFSAEERLFIEYLLKKYSQRCAQSDFRVRLFVRALRATSIYEFLSIDDVRYANELMLAGKLVGIRTHVFQHSNFDYLSGLDTLPPQTYIFPDYFYVWNAYWFKRIPELSPLFAYYRDRLRIGGRANGYVAKEALFKDGSGGRMTILLPYEVNVDKREILPYIEQLVTHPDTKILFKARSDMSSDTQVAEYLISGYVKEGKIEVITHLSDNALRDVDVVLGVYTTFLDEMIERGKPVGVFTTTYPVFNDLARSGIAGTVHLHKDIYEQVKILSETSREILLRNREVFLEGGGSIPETVRSILKSSK